jgi:hypothetical protein
MVRDDAFVATATWARDDLQETSAMQCTFSGAAIRQCSRHRLRSRGADQCASLRKFKFRLLNRNLVVPSHAIIILIFVACARL